VTVCDNCKTEKPDGHGWRRLRIKSDHGKIDKDFCRQICLAAWSRREFATSEDG